MLFNFQTSQGVQLAGTVEIKVLLLWAGDGLQGTAVVKDPHDTQALL